MSRLAAVTGATGFLGQHVVRALADDGWRLRILARKEPISPFWGGLTPDVVPGDLGDAAALARLCDGADLVVHAAGLIGGGRGDLDRINVAGSERLARAAAVVPRFLHISSITAREPQLSAYAASKRAGEDTVRGILGDRVTIVRPPAIYGPGDRETLRLFRLAASSPVLPVLSPVARVALVHVQDAASQIATLARLEHAGPFTLCDAQPEGYSWREIMQTAATALGRNPTFVRLPAAALYALASAETFSNGWRQGKAVFTYGKVRELTHLDWGVPASDRSPNVHDSAFDLASGFEHAVNWYRSQGWLKI